MLRLRAARLSITPSSLRLPSCLLGLLHSYRMFHLLSRCFIRGFVCTELVVRLHHTHTHTFPKIFLYQPEDLLLQTESLKLFSAFLWNYGCCIIARETNETFSAVRFPLPHIQIHYQAQLPCQFYGRPAFLTGIRDNLRLTSASNCTLP